jgi:hypothetical protein
LGTGGTSADRPLVWGLLTCLIAAVTAFMGYSIGEAGGGGGTTRAAAPRPVAAPALLPLGDVFARGRAEGHRLAGLAEDRAYVRGRKDGLAEGKRASRRARDRAGPQVPLRALADGRTYRLCQSGAALCEKPAKPARGR